MKKHLFLFATFLLLMFAGCSGGGGEDEPIPQPTPEPETPTITLDTSISTSGVSFSNGKGEQSISFTVNTDWTLSIAEVRSGTSWCTPSAKSGSKGNVTVKFTVTENTEYDDRSVSVTIKAGTASKSFKITQKGVDALLVTTNTYEVDKAGGSIEVEVKSNIDYQIEVTEASKSWISETNSRALTAKKHKFTITASEEYDKREGEIYIKSGDKKETVKVYQSGGATLVLTKKEYTISDTGETITIDIKSNFEYGIQMPNVDWISETDASRGMSSHTLKYVIAPNETYDTRSAEIIFYDKNSTLKDTVTIKQAQKDAIILTENNYKIDGNGGQLQIDVNHNVEFDISIGVDWITQSTSRALGTSILVFNVAENTETYSRSGYITFTSKDGTISQSVMVEQSEGNVLIIDSKDLYVYSGSGSYWLNIQSNVDFSVSEPDVDWLHIVKSRSLAYHSLNIEYDANPFYDSRVGKIVVTNLKNNKCDTITVTQAQKDAIVLAENNYKIDCKGGQIQIKVDHNVEFNVSIDVSWITQTTSRSLETSTLVFNIAENPDFKDREGTIQFISKDGSVTQTVKVHQLKNSSFDPSIDGWEDDSEHGGTAE